MNNMHTEHIIGVIQARMNSSRLPKKIMADILGKPMIWHIVNRLNHTKTLSKIVIATTNNESDIPLCKFAESENIAYYAGSENDILDRLYQTGKIHNATILVKINGDCPLVDPALIDFAVNKYMTMQSKPDLIVNSIVPTYPEGLQFAVFNFKTLCTI